MKIETTEFLDVNEENLDVTKVSLANKVIENVRPFLDDVYLERVNKIRRIEQEYKDNKNKVIESKKRLEKKLLVFNKLKKVKKLVERIEQLNSFGMLYGSLKHEMTIVLKVLDSLDENKLNKYLQDTMEVVNKRIS